VDVNDGLVSCSEDGLVFQKFQDCQLALDFLRHVHRCTGRAQDKASAELVFFDARQAQADVLPRKHLIALHVVAVQSSDLDV